MDEWCENCDKGNGCSVYDTRPDECKNFDCLWKKQKLPEYLRPDNCGIMFELLYEKPVYVGFVVPEKDDTWQTDDMMLLVSKINEVGDSVVIRTPEGKLIFSLGEGRTREQMHNDINEVIREE